MLSFFGILPAKPSQAEFARLIIREIKRGGHKGECIFNEEEFSLRHGNSVMYLENVHAEYSRAQSQEARKGILTRFITPLGVADREIFRREAVERAVAVVRERALMAWMDMHRRMALTKPEEGAAAAAAAAGCTTWVPITDWFCRAVALDFPEFTRLVTTKDLEEWGISFEEIYEMGLDRLRSLGRPAWRLENGFYTGQWSDDYDSSRALLSDIADTLGLGRPLFVLPCRGVLLVADESNTGGVLAMLEQAEQLLQEQPRPHNPAPLFYNADGVLTDYLPAEDSPLAIAVNRSRKLAAYTYYASQTHLLEKICAQEGTDVVIQKYTVIEVPDSGPSSYCVWLRGREALLPRADQIIFIDEAEPTKILARCVWEAVEKACPGMLVDENLFPARYRVREFPDIAVLAPIDLERDT